MLQAILALISAVLTEAPQLFQDIQTLLNNHPSNPANQPPLAPQVIAGTQAAEDALHNTVIK